MIVSGDIQAFLERLQPEREPLLAALEKKAQEEHIPIVSPQVGQLLYILASITKAHSVLEVGTAIGYSGLWLAMALQANGGSLLTIELDSERVKQANENFRSAGVESLVEVRQGDAVKILPILSNAFDLIFLDGAKGQYLTLLEDCLRLLKPGGIMVVDNVLFRGMVANPSVAQPRYKTLVRKLNLFLEEIMHHPDLSTSILPISDGVAISWKRGGRKHDGS